MEELYEEDFNNCEYSNCNYYENDTGYREYECTLVGGECRGGCLNSGCPLSFKYKIES